jgi:hypothetical protein
MEYTVEISMENYCHLTNFSQVVMVMRAKVEAEEVGESQN